MDLNIYYEFYKIYLFYSNELYNDNIYFKEKYIRKIIKIYNKLYENLDQDYNIDKISNYYYIEKKNNFKIIGDKFIDIKKEVLFLYNNYNYYTKHTNIYYKIDINIIKENYILFYKTVLTSETFFNITTNVFKYSVKYIKAPVVPIDIKINRRNIKNICTYFNLKKI